MNRKMLTRISAAALAAMVSLAGCGSGTSSGQAASGEPAAKKDSVNFRLNSEPVSLDPHNTSDTGISQNPQYQIFDSLTRMEQDGTLNMAIAESLTTSPDGLKLTAKIRPGVKFHNGDTVTADDVVFSLNRSMESKYNTVMTSCFDKAVKVDDSTVDILLKYDYAPADKCLACVQMAILPQKAVEADPEGFARNPVGTGPYKFVSWSSGDKIVLDAFDDYYRGAPTIKHLTFINIPDHSTALVSLEKGEIDVMINPNMSDRQSIVDNPNLVYHESPAAAYQLFTFNNEKGRFADRRLRQAVSMAIDREAILIGAKEGLGMTVEAAMLPILDEFPQDFKSDPYDPEAARQLVIDAGYPDGLTVKVPTIDAATYIKPTTMLQEMLRPIGINLEIEIMERGAWNQKVLVDTDYELCMWAVPISVLDADFAAYGPFYSGNRGGSGNFSNCNIPRIDELVQEGRITPPGPERNEIYKEFCEVIRDECVIVPFLAVNRELPARANLKGISANPTMRYYFFDAYWE